MLDPMLEVWVRGIQQKISSLKPMFTAYVNHLAANPASQNIQPVTQQSILDEDDSTDQSHANNIIDQLSSIDFQLTHLLTVLDVGEPVPEPKVNNTTGTLGNLLGTLKSVLPVKQMVAMWFQTEMITNPESIYYSPNFGPDAWLDHDKNKNNEPTNGIPPV